MPGYLYTLRVVKGETVWEVASRIRTITFHNGLLARYNFDVSPNDLCPSMIASRQDRLVVRAGGRVL